GRCHDGRESPACYARWCWAQGLLRLRVQARHLDGRVVIVTEPGRGIGGLPLSLAGAARAKAAAVADQQVALEDALKGAAGCDAGRDALLKHGAPATNDAAAVRVHLGPLGDLTAVH